MYCNETHKDKASHFKNCDLIVFKDISPIFFSLKHQLAFLNLCIFLGLKYPNILIYNLIESMETHNIDSNRRMFGQNIY